MRKFEDRIEDVMLLYKGYKNQTGSEWPAVNE